MNELFLNIKRAQRLIRVINFNPRADLGPLCLDVAVTSRCNHKCIFCAAHSCLKEDTEKTEELDRDVLENLLEDCVALGVREIVFAGNGEPLLYKGLPDIISRYGEKIDIRMLTNGSTLDMITEDIFAKIGKLTISMNSINAETHRLVHGYAGAEQYSRIKKNIERCLKLPNACRKIAINYVICKDNLAEFPELLRLAQKWDLYFAIRPMSPMSKVMEERTLSFSDIETVKEELGRLKKESLSQRMLATVQQAESACNISESRINNSDALRPCYFGFYWGNIWSNGDYAQCTYDGKSVLGNLKNARFKDIWKRQETQAKLYAAALMNVTGTPVYGSCKGCTGMQVNSVAFHNVFKRIPFQRSLLKLRADKVKP
ncbi:MAG: radical SAM/SPASM domain-containing protein [Syntrophales bacterium]